jgi:1,4-dihydroxy-2-naphthoyl-CoA hydrolase
MPDELRVQIEGTLPGLFGIELLVVERGHVDARMDLRPEFLAPNGYLHAATVVALADSCCGIGCRASLPEARSGFTTVELKVNFMRTARDGALRCDARLAHGGRTTQVWDATVLREHDGNEIALFRCTQYLLAEQRSADRAG